MASWSQPPWFSQALLCFLRFPANFLEIRHQINKSSVLVFLQVPFSDLSSPIILRLRIIFDAEEKKKQRKNKKKKVKFAENVKETKGNGEEYRKKSLRRIVPEQMIKPEKTGSVCRNDMPANRIALYNGILRDRDHRIQCSYWLFFLFFFTSNYENVEMKRKVIIINYCR